LLDLGFVIQQNDSVSMTLSTSSPRLTLPALCDLSISSDEILEPANRQNKLHSGSGRKFPDTTHAVRTTRSLWDTCYGTGVD
jgi:hypothetical protein